MKILFFPRLALRGIRKNRKLYLPYILSCAGMVAMFYIIHALSYSPVLYAMRVGATSTQFCLSLGKFVIAVFSLLFLYYTSSFLVRRRNREFGLYNVLGMDKRGIAGIIVWDTLMVAAFSLVLGLGLGIAFYKFAELGLLNALHAQIDYHFSISPQGIAYTIGMYVLIFFLLLLRSLWQVHRSNPAELLRSEAVGEKPPKSNWFFSMLGLTLLLCAYILAVRIQDPVTAVALFFVAVIVVVIATYLLFISGSVSLCGLLQKRKRYYYKSNHFVSVSSMRFRMKRNGAGLASICILSTMVLVMLTSTTSLYFGLEDSLHTRYPRELQVTLRYWETEAETAPVIEQLREAVLAVCDDSRVTPENILDYRLSLMEGRLENGALLLDPLRSDGLDLSSQDSAMEFDLMPLADYNAMAGTDRTLEPGQVLVCAKRSSFRGKTLTLPDGGVWQIADWLDELPVYTTDQNFLPSLTIITPDFDTDAERLDRLAEEHNNYLFRYWFLDFDAGLEEAQATTLRNDIHEAARALRTSGGDPLSCSVENRYAAGQGYYDMYGGLLFLGIVLSIVFLFAAVLIIYYKQVCEGYEDQARFDIMKSVGMTARDIKKSINSQILTVFFAPLLFAGLHLGFAYPLIWKILQIFSLSNLNLLIRVTVVAFLVFALLYAAIFKITAGAYYSIVSKKEHTA